MFGRPGGKHSKLCNCLPCKVVLVQTIKYRKRKKLASAIDAIVETLTHLPSLGVHRRATNPFGVQEGILFGPDACGLLPKTFAVASWNLCKLVEISNWQNLRTFEKLTNWHLADHVITIWPKMRQSKYRSLCIYQKLYILFHSKGCAVFLVNWFSIRLVRLHNMWRDLTLTEWKQTTPTSWCHYSPDHL